MLEIVDAYVGQVYAQSRPLPRGGQHLRQRPAFVGEDMRWMLAPTPVDDRSGNPVEDHQPLLAVFDTAARHDENRGRQLGHQDLPVPAQVAELTVAASRVNGKQCQGLSRSHWSTATPIRKIFKEAFAKAGLPYFHPHSFRRTLAQLGERLCHTPEEFEAWSQNLGHETVLTTFSSYGEVARDRQAKLIRQLGQITSRPDFPKEALEQVLRYAQVHGRSGVATN